VVALSGVVQEAQLIAGVDYPRSHAELIAMFPDDAAVVRYLQRLRWPERWACVRCGVVDEPWVAKRGRMCRHCRSQQRVLAGTLLDRAKTPLTTWVVAA